MPKKVIYTATRSVKYLVGLPLITIVVFSLIMMLCRGQEAGYSAILGGLVWVLPTLYFAYRVLFADIRKSVKSLVWSFYRAEITKLAFSAMLFVITVKLISVNTLTVLLAFLVAQISFWVASLFYLWLAVR